jgi:DNA-binding XRE family transcriptional regulator
MYPSSNNRLKLSRNIKKSRIEAGWRQSDLADRLGVLRETVSAWETNRKSPNAANIVRMLEFFPNLLSLDS